jgi:hypothetical protein
MQGICTYIPEAIRDSREYSVAAILLLLFIVHITLFPILNLLYFCICTRWFKYDRDDLCANKSQFVPVIFEPPCTSLRLSTHETINAAFDRALANASCVPGLRARFSRSVVREISSRAFLGTLSEIARLNMYAALPFLYFPNARQQSRVS